MALIFFFLYFPIGVLVVFSFNASRINATWQGFTLDWYRQLFHDFAIWAATSNSLIVGVASAAISTVIGTMAAFALHRYSFRGKAAFESLLQLPIVIPEIVMGVSLLAFFVLIEMPLGLHTVTIAHVAFNISFVTVVVRARLYAFDFTLEEAAMDLGANRWQTFFKVTLPLIAPGVAAGFLIALTLSLDDFIIAFFTAGPGANTLPMQVYSMMRFGVTPKVNALSTLMLAVVMLIGVVGQFIFRGRKETPVPEEEIHPVPRGFEVYAKAGSDRARVPVGAVGARSSPDAQHLQLG